MAGLWVMAVLLLTRVSEGARILVFQPLNARSHSIVMEPLFEELAARGHHLTVITCFPHKSPLPNLHEVDVSPYQHSAVSNVSLELIREVMPNPWTTSISMTEIELLMCEKIFPEEPLQKLLKSDVTFDLVMSEIFVADCLVPFAHKFKAPLIAFVTSSSLPWMADRVGLPDNPSYIPNYFLGSPPKMTFLQRIYNTVVYVYTKTVHTFYTQPKTQNFIDKYYNVSIPPLHQLVKNTSMLFINSHFSLTHSRPLPPNVLEIGGIHLKDSLKPLPKDLQNILDRSTQGVVLMSFGTLIRVAAIPREVILTFLKVFSTLPQTVLLKYEEALPEAPPNVIIRKWLPQKEILAHKHLKAVIGHGGMASTVEAVYFGKPLIGVPFFSDQHFNLNAVSNRGAGITLDLDSLTEGAVKEALTAVLKDPTYADNMRRLSLQFRDRPMTALQSAVYWTEYVIRHQGAPHLQPASVHLPLYQYLLIDVIAVLLLTLFTAVWILKRLFCKVRGLLSCRSDYDRKKKNT